MEAWVTLATSDTYALGALVLGHSLRRVGTSRQLAVMITDTVTSKMQQILRSVFDDVIHVNVLDSGDEVNLGLIRRPDLGVTFTKLHCWRLTQFTKCVFLDADTLVIRNSDELFDRPEISAAPDIGWPDCFNTGVFVFQPSLDTYTALLRCALEHGSFDGGDQGLLNIFFSDWYSKDAAHRLPFVYNMSSSAVYSYTAAYKHFAKEVKIVHFLGAVKPWHHGYAGPGQLQFRSDSGHSVEHIEFWWQIFAEDISPHLDPECLAGPAPEFERNLTVTCEFVLRLEPLVASNVHALLYVFMYYAHIAAQKEAHTHRRAHHMLHTISMPAGPVHFDRPAVNFAPVPRPQQPPVFEVHSGHLPRQEGSHQHPHKDPPQYHHHVPTQHSVSSTTPVVPHEPSNFNTGFGKEPKHQEGQPPPDCPPAPKRRNEPRPVFGVPLSPPLIKDPVARARLAHHASELAGRLANVGLYDERHHKKCWEDGAIDYTGRDSFDNIQKKLEASIAEGEKK